jgi:hypothetical protein
MLRLLAPHIKLIGEPNMDLAQSQIGPLSNDPFSAKTQGKSRFPLLAPVVVTEHSSKEVAAHETFLAFFRLNRRGQR